MKLNVTYFIKRIFRSKELIFLLFIFTIFINLLIQNVPFVNKLIIGSNSQKTIDEQLIKNRNDLVKHKNVVLNSQEYVLPTTQIKLIEKEIRYPSLLKCHNDYNSSIIKKESDRNNYNLEADESLHNKQIVRAVMVFYPALQYEYFEQEFMWLYRSWIEMQKYEPKLWRTDLVVFLDHQLYLTTSKTTFQELNCSITNVRKTRKDEPMCTILDYVGIKTRNVSFYDKTVLETIDADEIYHYLYKKVDIFNDTAENLWKFYGKLKEITSYNYLDSIIMAFDGYKYFKDNFDFLLRTDMDIFLTPLFAKWLPLNCNDFIVGGGSYGHDFNMKRLKKAAKYMNLEFSDIRNLGSTWYSTPAQIRLVSYLTLVSMAYINSEEFSEPERQSKVGTILWPG